MGQLPPRHAFILNTYPNERLSKCPRCRRPTRARKFPLWIHIDAWGPMIVGKTCVYCTACDPIVAHQHELEAQLAYALEQMAPAVIGFS